MKRPIAGALILLSLLSATGCWNKFELTEWGFVQAVAIDMADQERFELVTHLFKPSSSGSESMLGDGEAEASSINIRTQGDTIFEAVRDIPMHLGRKAQWSHTRTILIGEEVAKEADIGEVLDFFTRDHEPRGTISIVVTKGRAGDYLQIKPLIEHTMGQQLRKIEVTSSRYSAKTTETTLLDLNIQLRSQVHVAMVPYVHKGGNRPETTIVAGLVLLKDGKMAGSVVPAAKAGELLMLTNNYKGGVMEVPCPEWRGKEKRMEDSFEVSRLKTSLAPRWDGSKLTVRARIEVEGSVGEIHCSSVSNKKQEEEFIRILTQTLEKRLQSTVSFLQKNKTDAIGIGNAIYRSHPKMWNSLKEDWGDIFAAGTFTFQIEARILSVGVTGGKPFSDKS